MMRVVRHRQSGRRRKPYRHRHPVVREAHRIGLLALAGWAVASAVLALFFTASAPVDVPLAKASSAEQHLAAKLTFDPVIGARFSDWWNGPGAEPVDETPGQAPAPVVTPAPTPKPSPVSTLAGLSGAASAAGVYLPILYYHHPPADFDAQLTYLEAHGYQVITMDDAIAGLHDGVLPSRAVTITFDDGFSDQMEAFAILQRHHMPATFYIINGSAGSNWCIGAGRKYHLPSQPAGGCGDDYLTWSQVKQLDESGLISIGGHTLDHANLPALAADEQYREIHDSKVELETLLGHPIYHFAYPYGSFTALTSAQVERAGYASAVSTIAGTEQYYTGRYALQRIRNAFDLPY